jgi:hypothetical protein
MVYVHSFILSGAPLISMTRKTKELTIVFHGKQAIGVSPQFDKGAAVEPDIPRRSRTGQLGSTPRGQDGKVLRTAMLRIVVGSTLSRYH